MPARSGFLRLAALEDPRMPGKGCMQWTGVQGETSAQRPLSGGDYEWG